MAVAIRKGQPSAGDVHVSRPLTNISVAFSQDASSFIANQVFPVIPVNKQSDKYFVYDRGNWQRGGAKKRAPSTESAGGGYTLSQDSYSADVWALHKDVDDQVRANSDDPLAPDQDASRWVTENMLITKEQEWAARFFIAGVWTTESTPTNWDTADYIKQVETQRLAIKKLTGKTTNVLVVGAEVWSAMKNNSTMLDRVIGGATTGQPAIAMLQLVARLMELDRILVADAVANTATEGASDSNDFVLANNALLMHVPATPGIYTPSAGYTFAWTGLLGAGAGSTVMSRWREQKLKSWRVEGECAYDHKVVSADLGHLFLDLT